MGAHTCLAVGRVTVVKEAVELVHVQLRVHMRKIDLRCFWRSRRRQVSINSSDIPLHPDSQCCFGPEPPHRALQSCHVELDWGRLTGGAATGLRAYIGIAKHGIQEYIPLLNLNWAKCVVVCFWRRLIIAGT